LDCGKDFFFFAGNLVVIRLLHSPAIYRWDW
jgi:hypothetical protein